MGETQKRLKTMSGHGFSQFELTTSIVKNLKQFDLTPVAKLVLVFLTTHYNEEKNGAVVFPSMPYIADSLGIGLTATKQAIKDLVNEGLIIKSKRDKINGNYNKYLLTLKVQNTTSQRPKNELFKRSDFDCFHKEQKRENKKRTNVVDFKEEKREAQILTEYAEKHGAKNVNAYIKVLQQNGADKRIIREYKQQQSIERYWKRCVADTNKTLKMYNSFESDAPTEEFKALKADLLRLCGKV